MQQLRYITPSAQRRWTAATLHRAIAAHAISLGGLVYDCAWGKSPTRESATKLIVHFPVTPPIYIVVTKWGMAPLHEQFMLSKRIMEQGFLVYYFDNKPTAEVVLTRLAQGTPVDPLTTHPPKVLHRIGAR